MSASQVSCGAAGGAERPVRRTESGHVASVLEGLSAVDFSNTLTGAHISQLLGDFGAEVVCVEPPGGNVLRSRP